MSRSRLPFVLLLLISARASAFDYLEHSFLSDKACLAAQRELSTSALTTDTAPLYLALSLTCPESWSRPYCSGGYKQFEGSINRLDAPPAQSHDQSITLGDLAALQDHLAELGQVSGVPQASKEGLATRVLEWLASTGDAGGVISDVAEDACETNVELPWSALASEQLEPAVSPQPVSSVARAPARKVVADPAGPYSFDNPQYLDLVLHNHIHFGREAFRNWQGLHQTARDVFAAPCERIVPADAALYERLARGLPDFDAVGFSALAEPELRARGCDVVAERLRLRVVQWSQRADTELSAPAAASLAVLKGPPTQERRALSRALVSPFIALVFEGAGLHYLQDTLSGGHVRLERASYGLADSRYQHDADSRNGVPVAVSSSESTEAMVAFGDGYLLDAAPQPEDCDAKDRSDETITRCLLRRQRQWVVGASAASVLDLRDTGSDQPCVKRWMLTDVPGAKVLARHALGAPPNPPPPFSYQSFLLSTSVDAKGGAPQLGVRTVFLSALGARANWMTSYHVGVLTRLGQGHDSQLNLELSYMFHWRWAARWLLNAGPYAFVGAAGFGDKVTPLAGIGPSIGTSVLPEGWIRLPLEVTVSYRLPLRLYDGRTGFLGSSVGIEAHWLELAVGLAFM